MEGGGPGDGKTHGRVELEVFLKPSILPWHRVFQSTFLALQGSPGLRRRRLFGRDSLTGPPLGTLGTSALVVHLQVQAHISRAEKTPKVRDIAKHLYSPNSGPVTKTVHHHLRAMVRPSNKNYSAGVRHEYGPIGLCLTGPGAENLGATSRSNQPPCGAGRFSMGETCP